MSPVLNAFLYHTHSIQILVLYFLMKRVVMTLPVSSVNEIKYKPLFRPETGMEEMLTFSMILTGLPSVEKISTFWMEAPEMNNSLSAGTGYNLNFPVLFSIRLLATPNVTTASMFSETVAV